MFKPLIAAAAAAPLFAGAAFAGPYVNVEANASYPDGEYTTATTDLHFGFEGGSEKVAWYVQAGPGFIHTDSTDDTETEISGKVGVSVAVADGADVYGEIAVSLGKIPLVMTSLISLVKSALSTFSDSVNEHNYKGTLTGSLFLC